MPNLQHLHSWAHVTGGLQCQLAPCTAFLSHAVLQANITNGGTTRSNNVSNFDEMLTTAWKKAGN